VSDRGSVLLSGGRIPLPLLGGLFGDHRLGSFTVSSCFWVRGSSRRISCGSETVCWNLGVGVFVGCCYMKSRPPPWVLLISSQVRGWFLPLRMVWRTAAVWGALRAVCWVVVGWLRWWVVLFCLAAASSRSMRARCSGFLGICERYFFVITYCLFCPIGTNGGFVLIGVVVVYNGCVRKCLVLRFVDVMQCWGGLWRYGMYRLGL